MKDLVEFMAKSLVEHPEDVEVSELVGDKVNLYELKVHSEDVGKIIGRRGRTVGAMRIILKSASTKHGKKVELEVVE